LNFSQTPTLQKGSLGTLSGEVQTLTLVSPSDEVQGSSNPGGQITPNATGTKTVSCGSMTVSVAYPYSAESSIATCDFSSLPAGSKNVSYRFVGSGPSGQGTFSPQEITVVCGQYYGYFSPLSYANIYLTEFAGTPANVVCRFAFYGKCNGTAYGGGPCTFSITNIQGTQTYTY